MIIIDNDPKISTLLVSEPRVLDLLEVQEIYWLRNRRGPSKCQVTFKLPPRHDLDISIDNFMVYGDYSKGKLIF